MLSEIEVKKLKKMGLCDIESGRAKNILIGISLLSTLIAHGAGNDCAILILEYIGWLWIARSSVIERNIFQYFQTLSVEKKKKVLWNSNFLELINNEEKMKENPLFSKLALTHKRKQTIIFPLDIERIKNITTRKEFFHEYINAFYYPGCLKTIETFGSNTMDVIKNHKYVRFNPHYNLVAIIKTTCFAIVAFAGKERRKRGLVIYSYNDSPRIYSAEWSPNGKYLLILTFGDFLNNVSSYNTGGYKINIFKYSHKKTTMRKIEVNQSDGTEVKFLSAQTQTSNCLWMNSTKFIIPTSYWGPLLIAKIKKDIVTTTTLFEQCKDVRQILPENEDSIKYSGCFFVGNGFKNLIFWITNCHSKQWIQIHSHCTINIFNIKEKKLLGYIAVPGYVLEIQTIQVNLSSIKLL